MFFADHLGIIMLIKMTRTYDDQSNNRVVFIRNFNATNFTNFFISIENVNWEHLLLYSDVNVMFEAFMNYLLDCFDHCFPVKQKKKMKGLHINWYTDKLKKLKALILSYHTVYRSTKSNEAKQIYVTLKKCYNKK